MTSGFDNPASKDLPKDRQDSAVAPGQLPRPEAWQAPPLVRNEPFGGPEVASAWGASPATAPVGQAPLEAWPPPGPGVPPEPDSLRQAPPPVPDLPPVEQPGAADSDLQWVEVPAPKSYARDLLAAPPPVPQPASGPPQPDQALEPSWTAPTDEVDPAPDRLSWTDRLAPAPKPAAAEPQRDQAAGSPPPTAGPSQADRPAWMRDTSGSELFEPITMEAEPAVTSGDPLWPRPANRAQAQDHIFPPGYPRPSEPTEPTWGPPPGTTLNTTPGSGYGASPTQQPVEDEPRWAPGENYPPGPSPVELPVEEELRWVPRDDYALEPGPDQTPVDDELRWVPRDEYAPEPGLDQASMDEEPEWVPHFSPPPEPSPAAPPAADNTSWAPPASPAQAAEPAQALEQTADAAESVAWDSPVSPTPHPTAAARELLAASSATTQADPFDLFGEQNADVDQSDEWLNDPALAVIGDRSATEEAQAPASDTLEASEGEPEPAPEPTASQSQVAEPAAVVNVAVEPAMTEAQGHSRNPWVGLLWIVAVTCLVAGLALSEWASAVPSVITSTLANLGAWGMVGAFVMTGIDRRLRRRH